jgi:hypothetical protein
VVKVAQVVVVVVVSVLSLLPTIAEAVHSTTSVSETAGLPVASAVTAPEGNDRLDSPESALFRDLPWRTIPPVVACVLLAALPSLRMRSLVVVVAYRR